MSEYQKILEAIEQAVTTHRRTRYTLRLCRALLRKARNEVCERCGAYHMGEDGHCCGCRWE